MVSGTPWLHFTPGKDPVPILQEAWLAPEPVWTGGKSRPHRDSIPDRPSRSSVAIPTELPGPTCCSIILKKCRGDGLDFDLVLERHLFEFPATFSIRSVQRVILCHILFVFAVTASPPVGQGLLIHEVYRSHTTTHHCRWNSSGRVIGFLQRPLPDNTQHSQTNIHALRGIRTHITAGERPQTYHILIELNLIVVSTHAHTHTHTQWRVLFTKHLYNKPH